MSTANLDLLDAAKVSLSVPLIATYLKRGYRQAQIARICNVSPQAVNDYISRYYDDLAPLLDSDQYLAIQAKSIATTAMSKIRDILDNEDLNKRDLIPLNAVSGTHTDKYRLLSGQSTQIVDYHDTTAKMSALDQEIDRLKKELGDDAIDITPVKVEDDSDNQAQSESNNE